MVATINKNEALTESNIKFAFHHFDTNNDGSISVDDLVEAFHREGRGLSKEDIESMLTQVGIEKSDNITLEDFTKLITLDHSKHVLGEN